LRRVLELIGGRSLTANIALIRSTALVAAQAAVELMKL
jgi:pseudouridine-5'-phosphate glycosidase